MYISRCINNLDNPLDIWLDILPDIGLDIRLDIQPKILPDIWLVSRLWFPERGREFAKSRRPILF